MPFIALLTNTNVMKEKYEGERHSKSDLIQPYKRSESKRFNRLPNTVNLRANKQYELL